MDPSVFDLLAEAIKKDADVIIVDGRDEEIKRYLELLSPKLGKKIEVIVWNYVEDEMSGITTEIEGHIEKYVGKNPELLYDMIGFIKERSIEDIACALYDVRDEALLSWIKKNCKLPKVVECGFMELVNEENFLDIFRKVHDKTRRELVNKFPEMALSEYIRSKDYVLANYLDMIIDVLDENALRRYSIEEFRRMIPKLNDKNRKKLYDVFGYELIDRSNRRALLDIMKSTTSPELIKFLYDKNLIDPIKILHSRIDVNALPDYVIKGLLKLGIIRPSMINDYRLFIDIYSSIKYDIYQEFYKLDKEKLAEVYFRVKDRKLLEKFIELLLSNAERNAIRLLTSDKYLRYALEKLVRKGDKKAYEALMALISVVGDRYKEISHARRVLDCLRDKKKCSLNKAMDNDTIKRLLEDWVGSMIRF